MIIRDDSAKSGDKHEQDKARSNGEELHIDLGICEILVNLICVSGRPTWTPLQKKGAVALSHFGFVRQLSFFILFHRSILFF